MNLSHGTSPGLPRAERAVALKDGLVLIPLMRNVALALFSGRFIKTQAPVPFIEGML